jgi:hypothetical protein
MDTNGCANDPWPCYGDNSVTCHDVAAPATSFSCDPCPDGFDGNGETCTDIDDCLNGGQQPADGDCNANGYCLDLNACGAYKYCLDAAAVDSNCDNAPPDCMGRCGSYRGGGSADPCGIALGPAATCTYDGANAYSCAYITGNPPPCALPCEPGADITGTSTLTDFNGRGGSVAYGTGDEAVNVEDILGVLWYCTMFRSGACLY